MKSWPIFCQPFLPDLKGIRMLVLSRKLGEKIYIGEEICITVVDIDRGKIRLGISAPKDVKVYRSELLAPDDPRRLANERPEKEDAA